MKKSLTELYALWNQLGDTPVTEDGQATVQPFLHFPAGTCVQDIWHWLEAQNPNFLVGEAITGFRRHE